MTHFTRTRLTWPAAPPNPLLATECEDLDIKTYKAINGDDGGSWAPAAAIAIGQAGLSLGGANHKVVSGGTLTCKSGSTLVAESGSTVTFQTNVALDAGATVGSGSSITLPSAAGLTAQAGSTVGLQTGCHVTASLDSSCTLAIGSGCTFSIHADAAADITLGDAASFTIAGTCAASIASGATLSCAGTLNVPSGGSVNMAEGSLFSFHDVMAPVGKGRVRERVTYLSADANASTDIETTSNVVLPAGVLSADRKLTVGNTGASNGDIMHVQNNDPSRVLSVYQADGTTLIAHTKQANTNPCWLKLSYRTAYARWEIVGSGAGA